MSTRFRNIDAVVLNVPDKPSEPFEMPDNLEAIDEVIEIARDAANVLGWVADKINLSFPSFPDGDIREWVIEPVTGDFNLIIAGGFACDNAGQALHSVGNNITANSAKLSVAWTGPASQGYVLTAGLYAAVAKAAGFLMQQIDPIFTGLGYVSKELGETLAYLLGKLVDLCYSMAKFLAKKFAGAAASVGSWIWDALHGFEEVRDLIKDLESAWDSLMRLLDFKDEVKAYYEAAKSSFAVFQEFKSLAALLPQVVLDPLHQQDDLTRQLGTVERAMDKRTKKLNKLQDVLDGRAADGEEQVDEGVPQE
jgi:hypothetical protein